MPSPPTSYRRHASTARTNRCVISASVRYPWVRLEGRIWSQELLRLFATIPFRLEISLIRRVHHWYQVLTSCRLPTMVLIGAAMNDSLIAILFQYSIGVEEICLDCGQIRWALLVQLLICWQEISSQFCLIRLGKRMCSSCEMAFGLYGSQLNGATWGHKVKVFLLDALGFAESLHMVLFFVEECLAVLLQLLENRRFVSSFEGRSSFTLCLDPWWIDFEQLLERWLMMCVECVPADLLQLIITFRVLWIAHAIFAIDRDVVVEELSPRYKPAVVLLKQMLIFNARTIFV